MRSLSFTTRSNTHRTILHAALCSLALVLVLSARAPAQTVSVLVPDKTDEGRTFASNLEDLLDDKFRILDDALGEAAFNSAKAMSPYNLTASESKRIGAAIGCNFFILIRSSTLRRSSSKRPEYYEANAAVYAVSSRTGRLVAFRLLRFDAPEPKDAREKLDQSVGTLATELSRLLKATSKAELDEPPLPKMEEVPEPNSPAAKNFRAPIPYRRFKPEYTDDASLYNIEATVEIEVDLDAAGSILRTEIVRWAGYGLDESVDKTVREMNWLPAERDHKNLPMRFLLRYNFKKIEKE